MDGPRFEIAKGAEGYPDALAALSDAPKMLYIVGDPEALQEGIAVVGARRATPYGRAAAELFAGRAAERGIVVVSGGARGCDAFAHEAALRNGGRTVAFLGGGCNNPYPSCNVGLFQRIVDGGGAVVSEYPWDFAPKPWGFRARNRLIAGLARATLIVEAGLPSGTFSTADEALSAGKDVLAVPGSIFSPTSQGANALIAQGALPVTDEEAYGELLDRLFPESVSAARYEQASLFEGPSYKPVAAERDALLDALRANPMRLEQIVSELQSEEPAAALMAHVARLEALGAIERFPDGRFGAVSR